MTATTRDQLVDIVADALGCDPAQVKGATAIGAFDADSLDCLEIVMRAEDECAVTIADDEAAALATFGALVALVERKRVPA